MPPEVLYPRPVVYAAGQQPNTYGVVHAPPGGAAVAAPAPPPLSAPAPAPAPTYETRPNVSLVKKSNLHKYNLYFILFYLFFYLKDANATLAVPELSNYFMGLNVGNEQIAPAATPAPQAGYWGPSPNTSQTQVHKNKKLAFWKYNFLEFFRKSVFVCCRVQVTRLKFKCITFPVHYQRGQFIRSTRLPLHLCILIMCLQWYIRLNSASLWCEWCFLKKEP